MWTIASDTTIQSQSYSFTNVDTTVWPFELYPSQRYNNTQFNSLRLYPSQRYNNAQFNSLNGVSWSGTVFHEWRLAVCLWGFPRWNTPGASGNDNRCWRRGNWSPSRSYEQRRVGGGDWQDPQGGGKNSRSQTERRPSSRPHSAHTGQRQTFEIPGCGRDKTKV